MDETVQIVERSQQLNNTSDYSKKKLALTLFIEAIVVSLIFIIATSSAVWAETIEQEVILDMGMPDRLVDIPLRPGDRITLSLRNPTGQTLTFTTNHPLLGQSSWVIPPGEWRTATIPYVTSTKYNVAFAVLNANDNPIADGLVYQTIGPPDLATERVLTQTIQLSPGVGEVVQEDLREGDRLVLELVNPTDQAVTFEPTAATALAKQIWKVQPYERKTIVLEVYNRPHRDAIPYRVLLDPTQ